MADTGQVVAQENDGGADNGTSPRYAQPAPSYGWNNSGWNSNWNNSYGWNNNWNNSYGRGSNNRGGLVGGSDAGTYRP